MSGLYLRTLQQAGLAVCVLLALASTAVWWALTTERAPWHSDDNEVLTSLIWWSTGAVYSALVLFRYVTGPRRLAIVAAAGVFSYWLGMQIAITPVPWIWINAALAGVITATFLGYVVALLGRLRRSVRLFSMLAGAGAVGGAVIGWSSGAEDVILSREHPHYAWQVVGHGLWQVLTCVAFYLAPQDAGEEDGSESN